MNKNFDAPISLITPKRPAAAERRREPRHGFSADAEVVEVISGACLRMTARVADLSMGGCYLDTLNPFAPGTRTHLRIRFRNINFTCIATVKSAQPGMGMGLAFEQLTQSQTDLLNSWLDKSANPAPEPLETGDPWKPSSLVISVPTPANSSASASQTKSGSEQQANGNQPATNSGPHADAQPGAHIAHDELSLRLAKLMLRKGLLDQGELNQLLNNETR